MSWTSGGSLSASGDVFGDLRLDPHLREHLGERRRGRVEVVERAS
ncbi:hypothetical protein [Nonomuraea harbinensis]|uniref:Uncharacterized protein n=1 Tax=Nonomuraea harbinensis TaxID=1286938 RepID=A0ABW1CA10_9ACTN|nr:hypothetical protein [Nonomuraea harbinensis]